MLNRVVPFSNQQVSVAVGGPILRDRLHYFGNFEYDRTPKTSIWNTPFPAFNVTLSEKESKKIARRPRRLPDLAEHAVDGKGVRRQRPQSRLERRQRNQAPREHQLRGSRQP